MNEPRSSRIGWYLVSGFFETKAHTVEIKTRIRRVSANPALMIKKITPTTPVTMPCYGVSRILPGEDFCALTGWLKMAVKIKRKMTFRKLIAAIAMLKPLVLLSIHGRRMLTPMRKIASMMTRPMAWTVPLDWAKAMNSALTKM